MSATKRPASLDREVATAEAVLGRNNPPRNKRRTRRAQPAQGRNTTTEALLFGMERHNLRMIEMATSEESLVRLSNFRLEEFCPRVAKGSVDMYKKKPQPGLQPMRLCAKDGARIIVDQDDQFVLFYTPRFWGQSTQAHLLDVIDTLDTACPLQKDKDRGMTDKRVGTSSSEGSRRAEWGLHHHGIAQQFVSIITNSTANLLYDNIDDIQKQTLRPSPSLRQAGGKGGVEARQQYLSERALNDGKINHMTKLIHPAFHKTLVEAKERVRTHSTEGATWAEYWTSDYLNQAIFENRQTPLHRDSRGAHYCADFLYILGDFKDGDLFLPDLNLKLEWLPNSACMFDGRTFAHEVMPWSGERRLCLVNYIWKTSLDNLQVELPTKAPSLSEIKTRVAQERATRAVKGRSAGGLTGD
ncbi:hypothetical protein FRC11_010856 [Ceratobasidium sp. 423]|nr:hypothetical protein FRC11_010856 [Ceratobasidium sp. 423]